MNQLVPANHQQMVIAGRDYSQRDVIDTIKQTVAKGASDAQLQMFLTLAKTYDLDPFLKEIWCADLGNGMTVITSRDGYLKVAMRDPNYDGIVSETVCEGDAFEMDPIKPSVSHKFGAKRGPVIGAYSVVFHKNRRPAICYAPLKEYYRESFKTWQKYPSAMIKKVAEVFALKRQFGISGLVTQEEVGDVTDIPHNGQAAAQEVADRKIAEMKAGKSYAEVSTPEPKAETPKRQWTTFKGMVATFAELKARLGPYTNIYYQCLEKQGVKHANEMKSTATATAAYFDVLSKVEEYEAMVRLPADDPSVESEEGDPA